MFCRDKTLNSRQNWFYMDSIDDKIMSVVKEKGDGTIVFPADFSFFGQTPSVNKALERLVKNNVLIRLARGIYYYPKMDNSGLNLGILYPTLEDVAQNIAIRDHARIAPTGNYALNVLGLSTQVPMNVVYLTDGSPRKISIRDGRGIQFIHTAPKNLAFKCKLAMLITFALKEIGPDNVTMAQESKIKELLKHEAKEDVYQDFGLIPTWIKSIIIKCYE